MIRSPLPLRPMAAVVLAVIFASAPNAAPSDTVIAQLLGSQSQGQSSLLSGNDIGGWKKAPPNARNPALKSGRFESCAKPNPAWRAIAAEGASALPRLLTMAVHCSPGVAAGSMARYLAATPPDRRGRVATRLSRRPWPAAVRRVLNGALIADTLARLKTGTVPTTELALTERLVKSRRNAGAAIALGWRALNTGKPRTARSWFRRAIAWGGHGSARQGLVRSLIVSGKLAKAESLACAHRTMSPHRTSVCVDILATRQLRAYRRHDYAAAARIGRHLLAIDPHRRGARTLLAWADLKDGHADRAARQFGTLYDQKPNRALAGGLIQSLQAAGDEPALRARLATGDPLLTRMVAAQTTREAFDRKQFDLAERGPDAPPALAGRSGWEMGGGIETRSISGDTGETRMDIVAPRLFARRRFGPVRVGFTIVGAHVAAGTPRASAAIGRRPLGSGTTATLGAADILLPIVTLRTQWPDWSLYGRFSTTPLNGPVSPLPTADLAVTRWFPSYVVKGRLFADSVEGSMLSFTGLRDPVSGASWGRVMQYGGGGQFIWLPTDRISVALGAKAAALLGKAVPLNDQTAARLDLAYDFRPPGFDHLRIGPYLSGNHFNRDLSQFTWGQGGYYSPDLDLREGMLVDALTEEGRSWQVEAKTSLAYLYARDAASPRYPSYSDAGTPYPASTSRGLAAGLSLRASALLAPHLILSGFGRYSNAPQYTNVSVGAFLTIPFQARRGVFSSDLPHSAFTPFH